MAKRENDLGRDPIGKLLLRLAVPTVTAQLVNALYNIVDRIYIGHIPGEGDLALTGLGICFPVILFVSAISALVGMGGGSRAVVRMGEGKLDEANKILGNCTLLLMILGHIVHYFSTPYLMMKNSLSKMNAGWETTAMLMGDSWLQTILRVVTPNALSSLIEVFSYYFINSMVTISALIFIAGARTMVLTTMIKQLQYVNRFNEVFVLSLLILATNLVAKGLFSCLASYKASHPVKERRSIQLFGNRKEAVQ